MNAECPVCGRRFRVKLTTRLVRAARVPLRLEEAVYRVDMELDSARFEHHVSEHAVPIDGSGPSTGWVQLRKDDWPVQWLGYSDRT